MNNKKLKIAVCGLLIVISAGLILYCIHFFFFFNTYEADTIGINVAVDQKTNKDAVREYYHVSPPGRVLYMGNTDAFDFDEAVVYFDNTDDETALALMTAVKQKEEHEVFDISVWRVGDDYFVFDKLNVNLWTPCRLYLYTPTSGSGNSGEQVKQEELELWGEWDDVDLVGIQVREPLQ